MSEPGTLVRTSRTRRCPICTKPDWCSLQFDDAGQIVAAICMRTESLSPTRNGGWYHRLRECGRSVAPTHRIQLRRLPDWTNHAAVAAANTDPKRIDQLAQQLGVSVRVLRMVGTFWSDRHRAYGIPMFNSTGRCVGVRLRGCDGAKWAVPGSREGVFLPEAIQTGPLLGIAEGASDLCAALDLMPDAAWLGRPSCTGGVRITLEIARELAPGRVVLIADRDEPGQRGATALAKALRLICPDVRIVTPPVPHKDLRAWVANEARREDLLRLVEQTRPLGLVRA